MRKTKIVATLGPSTEGKDSISTLGENVDAFRLNFSHGSKDSRKNFVGMVRENTDSALIADTKGWEIRINQELLCEDGDAVQIEEYCADIEEYAEQGDEIIIGDNQIRLKRENGVYEVLDGGIAEQNSTVTFIGKDVGDNTPTQQDKQDIAFAVENGFDILALSFVKTAGDVQNVRKFLEDFDRELFLISKIEHFKAVENFEEILEVSDGIMVARGDLGIHLPESDIPDIQKKLIKKANRAGKPAITATQMLESMVKNEKPTRAEVSDVANSVLDGTDAVMLSEETSIGDYPVKAVEELDRIVRHEESEVESSKPDSKTVSEAVCSKVYELSETLELDAIMAHTSSGFTARNIAKFRPEAPVFALTPNENVRRFLKIVWGIDTFRMDYGSTPSESFAKGIQKVMSESTGLSHNSELALTASLPFNQPGKTNMLQVRSVEELLEENKDGN